ncbi:hypothetical protein TNCT_333181 [Trichonephila clavata]|uniref:Uncharacterized protein n=1 Tax=Trichonephila clavata TaxID=2740835 RepID=A0A8X6JLJ7_TRICU|nr:hypothetical protein TNCT_333181 [Trichonephila clavata]
MAQLLQIMEDESRTGHSSKNRNKDSVQRMHDVMKLYLSINALIIADLLVIGKMTLYHIITEDLMRKKVWTKFVTKILTDDLRQPSPSNSPDLAPVNFFLFPRVKRQLSKDTTKGPL